MRKIIMLGLLLTINLAFFSQVSFEKRIEFSLKEDFSKEFVHPVKENGLVVISSSKSKTNGKFEWKFDLYNTNLEITKTTSIFLDSKMRRRHFYSTNNNFYLLFINNKGRYNIINLNCKTGSIKTTEGEIPKKTSVISMVILNDYAFLSGKLKKSPILFSLDLNSGLKKIIPLNIPEVSPKKTKITNVQLLEKSNEVFVYIDAYVTARKYDKYVAKLNNEGNKKELFCLTKNTEQTIIEVSATKTNNEEYIYAGSFSEKTGFSAEGLFICKETNTNIDFINFYKFNEFKNFFSFLSQKRQDKIEKKRKKKAKKGKELKISYYIEGHDVIKYKNNYFFVGEAYYPTYRTETYTAMVAGKSTQQTRQVFDGYQYTHGIVTGFNESGNLIWNNTFKMWPNKKPFVPKKFISISEEKQNIGMAFADSDSIVSMAINYKGEIIKENRSNAIETDLNNDQTKYSSSNLDYWYDDYFVAYGKQKIKNKTSETDKRKRLVYFINKIKF